MISTPKQIVKNALPTELYEILLSIPSTDAPNPYDRLMLAMEITEKMNTELLEKNKIMS